MKKLYTLLCIAILTTSLIAQAPQKMSYQAVIRNVAGDLIKNTLVGMRISILQSSESGTVVYSETQTPTTNVNGLATLEVGAGTIVTGTFEGINWANGVYFIKIETDPTGGSNYTIISTSQLLSVPYALYSKTSGSSPALDSLEKFVYSKYPPTTNGLVAYYPFNGNANDESGNGNNGVVNGATITTDRFGSSNKAYSFDGSSAYIYVLNSSSLQLTSGVTISVWCYMNAFQLPVFVLSKGYDGDPSQKSWLIDFISANVIETKFNTNGTSTKSKKPFMTNNWYNIIVTNDGSVQKLYINSTLDASNSYTYDTFANSWDLKIGRMGYPSGAFPYYFNGNIDDIRIYNRALTPSEVKILYHEGGW